MQAPPSKASEFLKLIGEPALMIGLAATGNPFLIFICFAWLLLRRY